MKPTTTAALTAAAATLAGVLAACGSPSPAQSQPANVRVCQHYAVQRAWVLSLTKGNMTDALKFISYVATDAMQAEPGTAVRADFGQLAAAQQAPDSPDSAVYAASQAVLRDCRALGVHFTP